ncbi:MAG: phosphate acyltransferase PlsX [candidate division NC10 bacterium]|nr:phosphate acyltransferase PlsX [candidate division NC10 bacterium]
MGGDAGPAVNVEGAVAAARELGLGVILVGVQEEIRRHLDRHDLRGLPIKVRHASEVVEMEESPSTALRKKKDSSIRVAVDLVRSGDADAVVSAGNTGAVMAITLVVLGPLAGVERPAIAAALPTLAGHAILLDVGANVDCKPRHLVQFAIMGNVYARQVLGKARPRVGLLSIGEEETKGNELTKEAFRALEEEPGIEFIGNVEGVDVFKGYADVVVCDGFTGNVALKIGESVAETIMALVREEVTADLRSRAGALLLKPAFRRLQRRLDYSEVGGAPLLGVNGITIISHGRSSAKAIRNALRVAGDCVKSRVLDNIRDGIAES